MSAHALTRLGITQKNGRAAHPQTQGKVERFQQTMKKWLAAQLDQPGSITELQTLLDASVDHYNLHRPHRSLPHQSTPATAYNARPKATTASTDRSADTHTRVRHDTGGTVSPRVAGKLRHIGIGRTHKGTHVILLIHDLDVRVVNAATGEILRELTINPTRDYQPTGAPKGLTPK